MATVILAIVGVACALYGIAIMALWSGTSFFMVWYVLAVIFLLAAWAVHTGAWENASVVVKRLVGIVVAVIVAVLVVANGFIFTSYGDRGEDGLNYLVVLGAQMRDDGPSIVLQHRLDTAYDYLMENPETLCIVSGGQGPNEPTTEAEGMAAYLLARGVPAERIILEPQATTTVENIRYSMAFFDAETDHVGIVTNNFHVFRGTRIAQKCGIANVCGIAAPSNPFYLPNNLLRESLGVVKDFVFGNI